MYGYKHTQPPPYVHNHNHRHTRPSPTHIQRCTKTKLGTYVYTRIRIHVFIHTYTQQHKKQKRKPRIVLRKTITLSYNVYPKHRKVGKSTRITLKPQCLLKPERWTFPIIENKVTKGRRHRVRERSVIKDVNEEEPIIRYQGVLKVSTG